jgi:light-regulated signal transduction histidine kinase (bacteriophytochrome)
VWDASAIAADRFPGLVSLACHDLRTPLATVNGIAKMLVRRGGLAEPEARLAAMIDAAAADMASLLDELSLAARIASGRYDPRLQEADTFELASSGDARITVSGHGATVTTDVAAVRAALAGLALAALRHGSLETVAWTVTGRNLLLAPLRERAAAVVQGSEPRDLPSLVARMVLEALGGRLVLEGDALRVELA